MLGAIHKVCHAPEEEEVGESVTVCERGDNYFSHSQLYTVCMNSINAVYLCLLFIATWMELHPLCCRPVHISDSGCHRWKAGTTHEKQHPSW